MFKSFFSKLLNRSGDHPRKHHTTSENERRRGNGNGNDGGYTSAHPNTGSNNKTKRPPQTGRGGNDPSKQVYSHEPPVTHRPRVDHTKKHDGPKNPLPMSELVADTINHYISGHGKQ